MTFGHYMILAVSVGLPLTLVGAYMRMIRHDVCKFQEAIDRRLERMDERVANVEQEKVSHEDWLRVVTSQQHSLEVTRELVREIGGKLDASIGLGGSLKRVADALEHGPRGIPT